MLTGGCLCGKVRYVVRRRPRSLLDCHCIDCRRSSGAPYVSWGTVDREHFEVTDGKLKFVEFAHRLRGFAPCCGTQVLFQSSVNAASIDFSIASLDQPEALAPKKALWCEDHLPSTPLNPKLPAFTRRTGSPRVPLAK